ncbi:glycosyl transferase [Microbacterium sp.]|uniref:glycosyl transferase n=1 Tax=Microbacterium sp. TaxID=51671 RepID=UPI0039E30ABE
MRFVWAVVALVLATVMIGAGIAQRTVLRGPTSESQAVQIDQDVPYVLVDGAVLDAHEGAQTLRAQGEGPIFAAYGRTTDLSAWLSRSSYVHVTSDGDGGIRTELVEPATPAVTDPAADPAAAAPVSPAGSDLWLDEFQDEDVLVAPLQLPAEMSVLVASDGTLPAPSKLLVSWPTGAATPWAGPLIAGGAVLMAVGIVLYLFALRGARRARGPRRKGLPLAETQPIDLSVESADKGVISSSSRGRQLPRGARSFVAVPVIAVTALLASGCSADAWPQLGPTPTPSPTASVIVPEDQQSPAVTEPQAERILSRISATVAKADEARDADAAATRLAGPALAERLTNYTLRGAIADFKALPAIASKQLSILLPEAFDGWPRTFFAVVENKQDKSATIMSVTQQDAWSDYRLTYVGMLAADTRMPDLAPSYVGTTQVAPDSPFLLLPPDQLATAYADLIDKGDTSTYAALFEAESDPFRAQVAKDRAARLAAFNETGAETGTMSFASAAGEQPPVALATLESGAIVAVTVTESETVAPTTTDAVIKADGNAVVTTLSGMTQSPTGFVTTFGDQLFFFVPAQGSNERIQFLGFSSNPLSAKAVG